jgi:hypothetical protein
MALNPAGISVSLAFGATLPGTPGNYLDLDLVAMAINLGLSPTFGRDTATTIVLRFFNNWGYTVARAESDRSQDFFLGIGALGVRDFVKKIPKLYGVSLGTLDGINEDFRQQDESLVSACLLNISDIFAGSAPSPAKRGSTLRASSSFCRATCGSREFSGQSSARSRRGLVDSKRIRKNWQRQQRAGGDKTLKTWDAPMSATRSRSAHEPRHEP